MITDEKSPVFTNNSVIDIPTVDEISYDYDEMKEVIDDWANPYDKTIPIEVRIPQEPLSFMEALGGKCKVCSDTKLLTIRRIRPSKEFEESRDLKRIVENMFRDRKDPSHEFCLLCHNCIMYIKKISNARKSSGLSELSINDLEQIFTK